MPAGKLDQILSEPPLEAWDRLELYGSPVTVFQAMRMPGLRSLECPSSLLAALPYEDLADLTYLNVGSCRFASFEPWRLPRLGTCNLSGNAPLASLDAHGHTNLQDLSANSCSVLASVNVAGCSVLTSLTVAGCALPQAMVDQILADLVAAGNSYGYCTVGGAYGSNQPPSEAGLASKAILAGRGWTVVTK